MWSPCTHVCNIYMYGYGAEWRRLIGCLKLQVIPPEKATNYRALVRKMTYKDKVSYESSPPCMFSVKLLHTCAYVCICMLVSVWSPRTHVYNIYAFVYGMFSVKLSHTCVYTCICMLVSVWSPCTDVCNIYMYVYGMFSVKLWNTCLQYTRMYMVY